MSTFWNNFAVESEQLEIQKLVLGEEKTVEPTMLDVDDLVDEKVLASKNKEEGVVQDTTEPTEEPQVEDPEEETEEPDEETSEEPQEDEEDEDPVVDEGKEESEEVPDEDEENSEGNVATESYRHHYPHMPHSLSLEAYDNIYGGQTGAGVPYYYRLKNVATKVGVKGLKATGKLGMKGLSYVANSLKSIGIDDVARYLGNFYRGVLYVYSKVSDGLASSIYFLDKVIESHKTSLSSIEDKIDKTIKNLDKLIEADIVNLKEDSKYSNVKNINVLKLNNNDTDFNASNTALLNFINKGMRSLSSKTKEDIETVNHVMNLNRTGSVNNSGVPLSILDVNLNSVEVFKEGVVKGFETNSDKLTSYYSVTALPSNVRMIAHLPRSGMESLSDYAEAYNKGSMFLAVQTEGFRSIEEVDYMDSKELGTYLLGLKALAEILKSQSNFYEDLRDLKVKNRSLYKNYFQLLGSKKKKVRLRNSMVEIIYLRNMLTDKVYVPAVVDLHQFVLKYLDAGVSFAKMNLLAFEENNV